MSHPNRRSPIPKQRNAKKPSESQEQCASPEDLPCIRCGYNLRELSPDGPCPECGIPIHRSTHGDLLSAADPAWLTRVIRGQTLVYAALVTCLAPIVLLILFLVSQVAMVVLDTVAPILFLLAAILLMLGIFALTTPDPRLTLTEQPVVLRRIVRGGGIAGLLSGLVLYGLKSLEAAGGGVDPLVHSIARWTFGCALAFTWVAGSFYLAHLAERIPDLTLAKRTRSTAQRCAVCLVIYMLGGAVLFSAPAPSFEFNLIANLLEVIAVLAFYAGLFYALSLMSVWFKYRKPIKRCLLEARKMGAS